MPVLKNIAASAPGTSDTTLVTVPSRTYYVAQLIVCNQDTSPATFRVALDADGGTGSLSVAEAIFYLTPIAANESIIIRKLCLQPAAKVWVRASTSNVTFNLHGIEYGDDAIIDFPKILGASNGSSGSDTAVFTANSTNALGTSFKAFVCNTGSSPRTYRLHLDADGGGVIAATETIAYDVSIGPAETMEWEGLVLPSGGKFYYRASSTDITVVATGSEVVKVA